MPMGTQRFLFQSPDGGFSTAGSVDGFRLEQEMRQYQIGIRAEKNYGVGGVNFSPYLGAWFSYIDAEVESEFDIGGNFAHFEDRRSLKTYGIGLTVGVEGELPLSSGFYAFAGLGGEMRWNSSQAQWNTELDVGGNITSEELTQRDKQVTWGAMGSAGLGYHWQRFDLRVGGTAGISNHYPNLDIDTAVADGDPSIEWKSTSMWSAWVKGGVRF
jgi:hypothetical protein